MGMAIQTGTFLDELCKVDYAHVFPIPWARAAYLPLGQGHNLTRLLLGLVVVIL